MSGAGGGSQWDELAQGCGEGRARTSARRTTQLLVWGAGVCALAVAIGIMIGHAVFTRSDGELAADANARAGCAILAQLPASAQIAAHLDRADLIPLRAAAERARAAAASDHSFARLGSAGARVIARLDEMDPASLGAAIDELRAACVDVDNRR